MLRNLQAGLIAGLAGPLLMHILHFAGLLRDPAAGRLLWLAVLVHVAVLVWAFRYHARQGQGRFVQLLGAGMLISLLAGLLAAGGTLFFNQITDPTYLPWLKAESEAQLQVMELPEEDKVQRRDQIRAATSSTYATQALTGTMFFGLLVSAFLGILLRDKQYRAADTP